MAGMAGFEPTNARVKVWCLTAWRHPNILTGHTGYYSIPPPEMQSFFLLSALNESAARISAGSLRGRFSCFCKKIDKKQPQGGADRLLAPAAEPPPLRIPPARSWCRESMFRRLSTAASPHPGHSMPVCALARNDKRFCLFASFHVMKTV